MQAATNLGLSPTGSKQRFLTKEEYEQQKNETTKRELDNLLSSLKDDRHLQKTFHYKNQFFRLGSLRIHRDVWRSSIFEPLRWMTNKGFGIMTILLIAHSAIAASFMIDPFGLSRVFSWTELWLPTAMFVTFSLVYATQKASSKSSSHNSKLSRLFFTVKNSAVESPPQRHNCETVMKQIVELSKRKGFSDRRIYQLSAVISLLHTALPWIYRQLPSSPSSHWTDLSFPVGWAVGIFALFTSSFFNFLFYWMFIAELGFCMRNLGRRQEATMIFTSMLKKKPQNNEVEDDDFEETLNQSFEEVQDDSLPASFRRNAKQKKQNDIKIPRIKLDTPENIVAWKNMREFIQSYDVEQLLELEVAIAFLLLITFALFLDALARLTLLNHSKAGAFQFSLLFNVVICGLYILSACMVGGNIFSQMQSHSKILARKQWSAQQRSVMLKDQKMTSPQYASSPSQSKRTSWTNVVTPIKKKSPDSSASPSSNYSDLFANSLNDTMESPSSPWRFQPENYDQCQLLLNNIIQMLREDKPIYVISFPLDYSLLMKFGASFSVSILTRIAYLINNST